MPTPPAIALRDAVCARDFAEVKELLADDAVMRGLLPPRIIEATGKDEILGWFTKWFAEGQGFEVLGRDDDVVAGRAQVTWRFRFSSHPVNGDPAPHEIEQICFVDVEGDHVSRIDLLCSGFRPV